MQDRKNRQNSRKIRNLEKMIKQLHREGKSPHIIKKHKQHINFDLIEETEETEQNLDEQLQFLRKEQENDQNLLQSQQQFQFNLLIKTVDNLESLIESNGQKMLILQKKNQSLMNHLKNLKNLSTKVQFQMEKHFQNSSIHLNSNLESDNISLTDQSQNNIISKKPKSVEIKAFMKQKIQSNQRQEKFALQDIQKRKDEKKGPIRYPAKAFDQQKQKIKVFLNDWLKKNVKQHDSSSSKTIQKRIILLLYIKWKQLQNFKKKNNLTQMQIQQIITNEMKITFNCTCTTKGYEGISFIKRPENSSEKNTQNEKVTKQKSEIIVNEQKIKQVGENLQQEFSFDIQCESYSQNIDLRSQQQGE